MLRELVRYWQTDHDWRKVEARLNGLPQFITEIDGLDIHFIHVRSKKTDRHGVGCGSCRGCEQSDRQLRTKSAPGQGQDVAA